MTRQTPTQRVLIADFSPLNISGFLFLKKWTATIIYHITCALLYHSHCYEYGTTSNPDTILYYTDFEPLHLLEVVKFMLLNTRRLLFVTYRIIHWLKTGTYIFLTSYQSHQPHLFFPKRKDRSACENVQQKSKTIIQKALAWYFHYFNLHHWLTYALI